MCTGKCSKCIGRLLFPLGLCAIIANILLYFPNGEVLDPDKITDFVWYFHGILGAGLIVYLPAFLMLGAGGEGCCANRCGMLLSMLLSAMGFFGAVYCMIMSSLGLEQGPLCDPGDGDYVYPFRNQTLEESYLFNQTTWDICKKPKNVVLWNVTLFSILLAIGALEAVLCLIQVLNGLCGCLCGTCKRQRWTDVA
ncbi:transmembrane 4 L6 family member 1 isoform X2 [Acipenser oxyrinchus oxyrinchus]|uniref:Transmembrane 4 L6 family member 1 isoform X2 n=1 Tax=Acipenser oxyrinchus oxyrinchus TaxID=40147 RepID=A0AAD8CFM9_ACIOX|nr:transmembrane 4 L6 family member 1 isoform X2 [Acipenser oxyrinchus oxyrinchus]